MLFIPCTSKRLVVYFSRAAKQNHKVQKYKQSDVENIAHTYFFAFFDSFSLDFILF